MRQAWQYFIADLERYSLEFGRSKLVVFFFFQGAQASLVYRIGHWLYSRFSPSNPIGWMVLFIHFLFFRLCEMLLGISLEPKAEIGPGLYIQHFGQIIVGSNVKLGANCTLSQGVTLGVDGRGDDFGSPQIGDRAFIAPGAKVIGKITLGSDVVIGANAVVRRSAPDHAIIVGIPGKVVSYKGSFEFINYPGMENDPTRIESLARAMAAQTNGSDSDTVTTP